MQEEEVAQLAAQLGWDTGLTERVLEVMGRHQDLTAVQAREVVRARAINPRAMANPDQAEREAVAELRAGSRAHARTASDAAFEHRREMFAAGAKAPTAQAEREAAFAHRSAIFEAGRSPWPQY